LLVATMTPTPSPMSRSTATVTEMKPRTAPRYNDAGHAVGFEGSTPLVKHLPSPAEWRGPGLACAWSRCRWGVDGP
jgi:hypothetical protein